MAMRCIVVHYHLFKNAGSTIDSILKNKFGSCWGNIEGNNPWDTLPPETLLKFAMEKQSLKAISSHHARLPVPDCQDISFLPLIFLRHPIDRVGSVYSFERRQPKDSPSLGAKIARNNDIAGYVKWRLSEGNGCVIRNFQTVHLAGREKDMRTASADELDLRIACNRLDKLPFIGIVEMFEESICRMRKFLAHDFGDIDTSAAIHNKSPERKNSLEDRLEDIRNALGKVVYEELIQKNSLDIELYKYAVKLVVPSAKNDALDTL
jgi:hypothetical protein